MRTGHRSSANRSSNIKAIRKITDNVRKRLAGAQPACSLDMNSKIAVAQTKPGFPSQGRQRLHERPGFVAPSPTCLRVIESGQRVEQCVDIRRNV